MLKDQKNELHYSTVQRAAHARGLQRYRMGKTSRLTEDHKEQRLKFARTATKKDWSHTVFSDEHTFKQYKGGNPCHDIVWAKNSSEVPSQEVERWSMSVSAWAGIAKNGKTPLHFFTGTLDAPKYQKILQKSLLPSVEVLFARADRAWELQQDKASCHTARSTTEWLTANGVAVVDGWPTKGDDINPIENLWAILDERLRKRRYTTLTGMKKVLRDEWQRVSPELISNLIDSVPERLRRVRQCLGGSIKRTH
jgi:hypothetical protein